MGAADVWQLAQTRGFGRLTVTRSVLMFCPQFRPIVGGAERQAEKLSKALIKCGLRVTVLTPRLVSNTPEYEEDNGVAIYRFPLFDLCKRLPGVRGLGPLNLLSIRAQTMQAVSSHLNGVDIVHCHIASPMTAFAMQAARKRRVPALCKVAVAGQKTDLGELSRIGLGGARLAEAMIRQLNYWVATTQAVRRSLLDWGVAPDRIAMIPNGVDLDGDSVATRKSGVPRRFLYLGRLSTNIQRDVPTLVRAFDLVADRIPDAELALVGDGDLFRETADLVAKTRSKQRIQMPGQQKPEPWLQWADCFVLPSRYEGLSNALLEAMAHGLPCIANDIPQNREVLDDGKAGILVPVGDEDGLFHEMLRVATEAGVTEAVGKSALRRVEERYSIAAVADQYIELYEQLTGKDMTHANELATGERFAFGQNWTNFLNTLNEERIQEAKKSLKEMLEVTSLEGKSFCDAGSGSGLFSLAARQMGASVHSFDYDPQSVACTAELKKRYFPDDPVWVVEEGSVLDSDYLAKTGQFDIVYSWGVLHHTGKMYDAIENVGRLVRTGGTFFIAIYNNMGGASKRWTWIKQMYCRLPRPLRLSFAVSVAAPIQLYSLLVYTMQGKFGLFIDERLNYKKKRGMSWWHDQIDWIGGYPYEDAKPEEIFDFCKARGFHLERLTTCGGGIGCNQFVFSRAN